MEKLNLSTQMLQIKYDNCWKLHSSYFLRELECLASSFFADSREKEDG